MTQSRMPETKKVGDFQNSTKIEQEKIRDDVKMKTKKTPDKKLIESLIEETVQKVLREQDYDYGDLGVSDYGGGYGGGNGTGSSSQLYNTFVRPFSDVVQTAVGGLKILSAQAQTVVKGILFGLPTLI